MAEEINNISLSSKRSFSIDGDLNRIIYLDTSDMNILVRLDETYPEIRKLAIDAADRIVMSKTADGKDEDGKTPLSDISEILKDIDKQMRKKLNYIFASDIADICEPTGNMYDPVYGGFRFEHIIETLSTLYANNITAEFKKMQERVKKHTAKYTDKRRK